MKTQLTSRRGYTLMELGITVIVIGILASVAIPSYQKTVRRSQLQAAADILRTIQAGEQVYFAFHDRQYLPLPSDPSETGWKDIYMDSPNKASAVPSALFVVTTPITNATFIASAQININGTRVPALTINNTEQTTCFQLGFPAGYSLQDCPTGFPSP